MLNILGVSAAATDNCMQSEHDSASAGNSVGRFFDGTVKRDLAFVIIRTLLPLSHVSSWLPDNENAVHQATRTLSQKFHLGSTRAGIVARCSLPPADERFPRRHAAYAALADPRHARAGT